MASRIYEIPKRLVQTLRTVGPIHDDVQGGYCFTVRLVLDGENRCVGFVLEQRLAEWSPPAGEGVGMTYSVPVRADPRAEETYVYVETLADAIDYIRRQQPETS